MQKKEEIIIQSKPAEKNRFWKILITALIILFLLAIIIILSLNVYDFINANKNETNLTDINITDVPSVNGSNINLTYTPKISVCGDGKCNGTENYTHCARDCRMPQRWDGGGTTPPCTPDCANKNCGSDGCGSTCGECNSTHYCNSTGNCAVLVNYTSDYNCSFNSQINSTCLCNGIERASGYCCSFGWKTTACQMFESNYYADNLLVNDCSTYDVISRGCIGGNQQAFNTIQEAVNVVQPGQIIAVRQGIYKESIQLKKSGTPNNPIKIIAYPQEGCKGEYGKPKERCDVIIDGENIRNIAVQVYPYSYIHLEGFEIKGYKWEETIYVKPYNQNTVTNIEVLNCYIHENRGTAIYARGGNNGANNLLIENNEIYNNGKSGIWVGGDNLIVRANYIHQNGKDGVEGGGTKWLIESNTMFNQTHTDLHQDGLDIGSLKDSVIRNNKISDFTQLIYLALDESSTFENISIYGNILFSSGYSCPGIFIDALNSERKLISNILIFSNTIGHLAGSAGIGISGRLASNNITNITIRNNILGSNLWVEGGTQSSISSDYNLFYGTGIGSLIDGPNTKYADPQFVNYVFGSSNDFHLKSTSPAIDAGDSNLAALVPLPSPFFDIDGNPKPAGISYDIGSYEYTGEIQGVSFQTNTEEIHSIGFMESILSWFRGLVTANTIKEITGYFVNIK